MDTQVIICWSRGNWEWMPVYMQTMNVSWIVIWLIFVITILMKKLQNSWGTCIVRFCIWSCSVLTFEATRHSLVTQQPVGEIKGNEQVCSSSKVLLYFNIEMFIVRFHLKYWNSLDAWSERTNQSFRQVKNDWYHQIHPCLVNHMKTKIRVHMESVTSLYRL